MHACSIDPTMFTEVPSKNCVRTLKIIVNTVNMAIKKKEYLSLCDATFSSGMCYYLKISQITAVYSQKVTQYLYTLNYFICSLQKNYVMFSLCNTGLT